MHTFPNRAIFAQVYGPVSGVERTAFGFCTIFGKKIVAYNNVGAADGGAGTTFGKQSKIFTQLNIVLPEYVFRVSNF